MKRFWKSGDPFIWLTGGALALSLLMVAGLVLLVLLNGLGFFWPSPIALLTLSDGKELLGQVMQREVIPQPDAPPGTATRYRIQVKVGNRDLYGADFVWVEEAMIARRDSPAEAVLIERREWGHLYGFLKEIRGDNERAAAKGPEPAWSALQALLPDATSTLKEIRRIEKKEIGAINFAQEKIRLKLKKLALSGQEGGSEAARLNQEMEGWAAKYREQEARLATFRRLSQHTLIVSVIDSKEVDLPLQQIVRIVRPNSMGVWSKSGVYLSRLWEFISGDPRESNTEGGVFPAIFGTVMMVMIMSLLVAPLGVLAAFYLREYAKQGILVSTVRIAVNNLAGVPSIVFGVFGLGFFIYLVGGGIDRLFYPEALPTPTFGTGGILWASLTLALLTVPVVIVATEEGLAAIPPGMREASLALGATKFETTWRVVLPTVMPSILTGLILAMARAAGEVAPLMITGVVKLAPSLPIDGVWPFVHLERKFMHLGFHIYDVGFQSPNVDAARPMVYTTILLLLLVVLALNLATILIRNRLRKKYASSAF
ncbi:phosphate ABC transporter, permease protein PstA [Candidatus Methylomirabilis limnetica]|jgi:phosphate transport system permease protein|uniref:Phosphate transport system permease protein PstA n=1 Tax=Candidatus Methylomirabilis limnetica TaxID=2033718 RepID=A0A2T4TZ24_9BACT|nr:phosphate ABC transporter permease PstA [Candidatus Methylomirabilis limnetica]PTL36328.1 phosphate ABC transporter, permease protein PstA [Candidatus Methylomirabilis limnetica]